MRLISNIGSERVADVLPTNTPFDLITSSVSLEGAAVMAVAHKIERCLLANDAALQVDGHDRRRRNKLTMREESARVLAWLDAASVRATDRALKQSLVLSLSSPLALAGECELTTAGYLYENLADEVDGISALVTGSGTNKTSSTRLWPRSAKSQ